MIAKEKIAGIIQQKISGTDFFIVDIQVDFANNIRIEMDGHNGFSIANCIEYSRFIEKSLDREVEDFSLQVSSPGLENSFKVFEQYKKNIGKEVEVVTLEQRKVRGVLKEVFSDRIGLEYVLKTKNEKNKKVEEIVKEIVLLANIKETKIILKFK